MQTYNSASRRAYASTGGAHHTQCEQTTCRVEESEPEATIGTIKALIAAAVATMKAVAGKCNDSESICVSLKVVHAIRAGQLMHGDRGQLRYTQGARIDAAVVYASASSRRDSSMRGGTLRATPDAASGPAAAEGAG